MKWPMSHHFNQAIQNANLVFSDRDLRTSEVVVGARGLPLPRSGNFADVYQLRGTDGRDWAVKCFTRPVTGLGDRYAAVSKALAQAALPFTIDFTYLAEGIRIDGAWWPVVKMEWVEGLLLNQVLRETAGKPTTLAALGQMWGRLCRKLRECKIAHADLQHGNVLMVPGSRPGAYGLKLIDYDGMYVPELANQPSGENGHPCYQHPDRTEKKGYSPDVDRFPHILIATALKGLEVCGPTLWERYDSGDNLLFLEADIQKPAESKLMRELWMTENPALQALVGRLAIASQRPMPQTPWLDQIAPEGEPTPLDEETRRQAMQSLGFSTPVPMPLPPEPAATPAEWGALVAPTPLVQAAAKKSGITRQESRPDGNGPKRQTAREKEPKKYSKTLTLAIGSLWILVVGFGAVVALIGGKNKHQETADFKPTEPTQSSPSSTDLSKQKEKSTNLEDTKDTRPSASVLPKLNENTDDFVIPKPKENIGEPLVPIETRPVTQPILVAVKESRKIPVSSRELAFNAEFSDDGEHLVFMTHTPLQIKSFDVRSGETKRLPDLPEGKGDTSHCIVGNRLANWRHSEQFVTFSDITTGLAAGKIPCSDLAQPPKVDSSAIFAISPDTRYVVAGRRSPRTSILGRPVKTYLAVPFQIFDTTTGKLVLSFDWMSGMAQFTPDSSRVLVIEGSGHGRWFKLPSGEPDGEWQFDEQVPGMTLMDVKSVSRDGQRILCYGTARGQPLTYFVLNGLTGKLVSVLGQGFNGFSKTPLSGDGRLAVLNIQTKDPPETWIHIFDTAWGKEAAKIKCANISGIAPLTALSPNSKKLAITFGLPGREIIICDLLDRRESSGVAVKPKDTPTPSEVPAKPKDRPPPSDPAELKARWSAVAPDLHAFRTYTDASTSLLVLGSSDGVLALDLRTGAPRKEFNALTVGKSHDLFPLENDRFGTLALKRDDFVIWDAKTGQLSSRLTVPSINAGPANANELYVALARNKKYVAVARTGNPGSGHPDLPLKVVEGATRKVLVPIDWHGGSVHFTKDSSRVLIAEWTGRSRWFKLPSGEQDGGWDFSPPPDGRIQTVHDISADGALVAFTGFGTTKKGVTFLAILDGKNGKIVRPFTEEYHLGSAIAISENGRRAALLRAFEPAGDMTVRAIDVVDVATGAIYNRARIEPGSAIPNFALTPDGKGLVIQDPAMHKVTYFELIEP